METVDVLTIAAHPDDVELTCSGTLIKMIDKGYSVGILDLTEGEMGTRGTAEIRAREAEAARVVIGARFRERLHFGEKKSHDGMLSSGLKPDLQKDCRSNNPNHESVRFVPSELPHTMKPTDQFAFPD